MNQMMHHAVKTLFRRDASSSSTRLWKTTRAVLAAAAAATALTVAATKPSTGFVHGSTGFRQDKKRSESFKWVRGPFVAIPSAILSSLPGFPVVETRCEALSTPAQSSVQQHDSMTSQNEAPPFYYERMSPPPRTEASSHVIFGHLLQPDLLERYHIYRRVNLDGSVDPLTKERGGQSKEENEDDMDEVVVADLGFGTNLDGHPEIVHGGVLALIMDDAMGFAFGALGIHMAFTANLNVDYRSPVPAGASAVLRIYHKQTAGRKLYFTAKLTSPDGNILYAEGSSLYIIPREDKSVNGQ